VHREGLNRTVTLIAADERIVNFRHPIPKAQKAKQRVMLVSCAEFHGLISCLTRFVNFGAHDAETKRRHQAVCNIDAATILSTIPGRPLGEIFRTLQKAYAGTGFADEWKLHHQGGSTGYAGREVTANPDSTVTVRDNQAFAWNPSITGVKSEDTVLVTQNGVEVLTEASAAWPRVEARFGDRTMSRPDILSVA
jgi:Xaa-Pro aminopeptidase